MASTATPIEVKWNEELMGFWFLSNFLREEHIAEAGINKVSDALNTIYNTYCDTKNEGRRFQPLLVCKQGLQPFIGLIELYRPVMGKERMLLGSIHVRFHDDGAIGIIPF